MPTIDELAFVRSGDKGDISNVVVLARDAEAFAALQRGLRPEAITSFMKGLVTGTVTIYTLPRLHAFNIVMRGALGGGATATRRAATWARIRRRPRLPARRAAVVPRRPTPTPPPLAPRFRPRLLHRRLRRRQQQQLPAPL